ncbi:MAG: hypothetical protein J6B98_05950 [Bacilli bacterium]|nr:hypothetical protein [Bacilli bacterium]
MKTIQKRYIYAGILGAITFIILYLIINFNVIVSLFLATIMYLGGIFLYKEKDVREYNPDDINRYYFEASKISNYKNHIKDEEINKCITEIVDISSKILSALTQKPKKVTQVYNFFDNFMPFTNRLLNRYTSYKLKDNINDKEKLIVDNTLNFLIQTKEKFQTQLDNMYKVNQIDVKKEFELFKNVLNLEDLENEEGEVNDKF